MQLTHGIAGASRLRLGWNHGGRAWPDPHEVVSQPSAPQLVTGGFTRRPAPSSRTCGRDFTNDPESYLGQALFSLLLKWQTAELKKVENDCSSGGFDSSRKTVPLCRPGGDMNRN
jgi:hypothetical protein